MLLLYSDVAGFTSMCNKCTPTQVISMLKHLYTIFDALVVQHDLFKVRAADTPHIARCAAFLRPCATNARHRRSRALHLGCPVAPPSLVPTGVHDR